MKPLSPPRAMSILATLLAVCALAVRTLAQETVGSACTATSATKVSDVRLNLDTAMPFPNMPGVLSMDVRRPFPGDPDR